MSIPLKPDPVLIYALGGLNEVGKNSYIFENETDLIIVDAGVKFPGIELPGVDYVIPDYTHLKSKRAKIKALFITHGHEDHIGGIPFLLRGIDIPVIYAPRLAAALIRKKLAEHRLKDKTKVVEFDHDSRIRVGTFSVGFFMVTHSIPDSYGLVIETPQGVIATTGDFKVDLTPIGPDMDLSRIAALGENGVDLLLSDSTNAEHEGYTPSEKNVLSAIDEIFQSATGRLIISTFASNISRIQQMVQAAVDYHKKVIIIGRSMETVVNTSREFGYIKIPDSTLIMPEDINKYHNNEIVILCTGSQGEPMAALSRIAKGEHATIRIQPGDTVVFSSSPIPGNGDSINRVVNTLTRNGARVLTNSVLSDIHSSGHPSRIELRLMLKLMKPRNFMPVHGEYRMLKQHAELAVSMGMSPSSVFVLENGQSIELLNHAVRRGQDYPAGAINIDGYDLNSLSNAVLLDRKVLSDDGMVAVLIVIDSLTSTVLHNSHIYTKGFSYHVNNRVLKEAEQLIDRDLAIYMKNEHINFNGIKNSIKQTATEFLSRKTGRNPMIIPVIMNKVNGNYTYRPS